MFEDYLISVGVTILLTAIKNPAKKATIKKIALKVYNAIKAAYAGDPDFN